MKYMLLLHCTLSIILVNASERKFLSLTVNNEHYDPVEITYQQYISQPPYVKLKDHTSTATIAANSSGIIYLLAASYCNMNIRGFKALNITDTIRSGALTIHKEQNNQIDVTQDNATVGIFQKYLPPKKIHTDSSSDSESCIQS